MKKVIVPTIANNQLIKSTAIIKALQVYVLQNITPVRFTGLTLIIQIGDLITSNKTTHIKVIQLSDYQYIDRSRVYKNLATLIKHGYLIKSGPEYTLTVKGWQVFNELTRLYLIYHNIYQANIKRHFRGKGPSIGRKK